MPPCALRYAARPAAARMTTERFIRIGPGAELAAQAGGAELEGAGEAVGELGDVPGVDELGELVAGVRVGVLGQPGLGPGDEVVVHGWVSLSLSWCGCRCAVRVVGAGVVRSPPRP